MTGPRPDPLDDPMADALVRGAAPSADSPHAEELMLFGRFVGAWDVDVAYHGPDGRTEVKRGEWLFGWVLEGQGVQDVWRVPSRAEAARTGAPLFGYGTTVRFYDPRLGAWRSTWHGLVKGEVIPFIGREVDGEIHLEHHEDGGQLRRWAFSDITHRSFRWRNERSVDGGRTWKPEQAMLARRRSDSPHRSFV